MLQNYDLICNKINRRKSNKINIVPKGAGILINLLTYPANGAYEKQIFYSNLTGAIVCPACLCPKKMDIAGMC